MADAEKQPYVSCIRSFGRPILPPLMTDEKRRLMRHFKALACEREAAREKKKEAALPISCAQALEQDCRKNGVEIRATDSSPLPELLPSPPPSPPCRQLPRPSALLVRTASSSTVETGSSTTLVPSSPEGSQDGDDGASTVTDSSERRLLRDREEPGVREEKNGEPYSEGDSSLSTAQTTPATTPVTEDRFFTKVSVPSLCRSRSFVVERPSLALLLRKGLGQDRIADGVNVKVVKPWKLPNKSPLEDPQTSFTGAPKQAATLESTGVSETFVKEGGGGCGDAASVADSLECASDDGAKQQNGDVGLHRELGATFLRSEGQPMATPSTSFLNACALLDRNSRFSGQLVSESGGSCVSESPERRIGFLEDERKSSSLPFVPRALNEATKDAFEMPAEDLRVPGDGIALKTNPNPPCGSLGLPFAGREAAFRDNAAVTDETLNDVSNFQKDEDETVADDVFADALDDNGVLSNTEDLAKFGETFVSPWDHRGARFAPASTSSVRHSMSSPVGSVRSSGGESEVLAIPLDASWDAEEEEQYEDASEVCGSPDSGAGGRGDLTEDPERSYGASPRCDRRKSGEGMLSADDLFAAHDRKMHAFRRSLMQEYALWGPFSAPPVAGEHDGMNTGTALLETSGGRPTSPTSWGVSFGDNSSYSLPADLSSAASRSEPSTRLQDSSLASSIHLDLLSETRQSLHPKWRRCFDRLTAMARGHLTRRLMKTQRVQSIIQTIRDTLECALRLHGEPHIRSGLVTPQDVELHQRLITQLTSACHELHDVFFNIPVAERMQLIGQLRSQRKTRAALDGGGRQEAGGGRISSATQKVLERRLSKLTGRNQCGRGSVNRPTAVVRSQTFVATVAPVDTCRAAGGAPSGTTRKICRLPMYKV